jgi:hypothetical protein
MLNAFVLLLNRVLLVVHSGHFVDHSPYLTAITKLIVIPEIKYTVVTVDNSGMGIDDSCLSGPYEITGYCILRLG